MHTIVDHDSSDIVHVARPGSLPDSPIAPSSLFPYPNHGASRVASENCEFLTAKAEFISIITAKEPTGKIKAIVLRTTNNSETREPLIASDPFDTVQAAIESLHAKSSEAVQLYIMTNGYAEPRDLDEVKDDGGDEDDNEDDNASVVSSDSAASSNAPSVWSATSDTAAEVITPAQTTSSSSSRGSRPAPLPATKSPKKSKATNGRKGRKPPTTAAAAAARKPHDDYYSEDDDDDDTEPPRVRIIHNPVRQTAPPSSKAAGRHTPRQPPPPPSWSGPGAPTPSSHGFGFVSHPGPPPPDMGAHPQYAPNQRAMPPPPPPQPSMAHGLPLIRSTTTTTTTTTTRGGTGTGTASYGREWRESSAMMTYNAHNANNANHAPPPAKLHDVRLTITWLHHSSARVLETVRPSLRALQDAALAYVRSNPHAFENVTAADTAPSPLLPLPPPPPPPQACMRPGGAPPPPPPMAMTTGVWALRSVVKRAWFGDESWDLASYRGGDDLTRLFASLGQGTIPRLEVEVDYPRP
ncbi:hypothetical protein PG994_011723 [Apiospora phragmitis]|uniref:Uncharacterized protein n=1 Tax=Apiospora phragmitis TaxID=2905665 RepID=A0ABR1TTN1_9PEZI